MYYPEKIKQAPITGLAGFGGGASGAGISGGAAAATFVNGGDRALACGGYSPAGHTNGLQRIDYWNIASNSGSVADFGDVSQTRTYIGGCSDSSRGLNMGGHRPHDADTDTIDYVTIATTGNATDFGNMGNTTNSCGAISDATRAVCMIGKYGGTEYLGTIEYVTIQSTGNATDFGDMVSSNGNLGNPDGGSDGNIGIYFGGYVNISGTEQVSDAMEYITIATTGDATDWGDLHQGARAHPGGCGNHVRCLCIGGNSDNQFKNDISYAVYTTTGSSSDFGDLGFNRSYADAMASETRAVYCGGYVGSSTYKDNIDYVTIDTTGDSTDWGDLHQESYGHGTFTGDAS